MKQTRIKDIELISKKATDLPLLFLHSCDSLAKPESPHIPFTDATFIRMREDNMNIATNLFIVNEFFLSTPEFVPFLLPRLFVQSVFDVLRTLVRYHCSYYVPLRKLR